MGYAIVEDREQIKKKKKKAHIEYNLWLSQKNMQGYKYKVLSLKSKHKLTGAHKYSSCINTRSET